MWRTGEANQHSAWRKGEPLRGSNAFSDPSSACWNGPDGRNISRSGLNRLQRSQAIVAGLVGATYIEEQSPVLRIGGHLARVLTAVWHGKAGQITKRLGRKKGHCVADRTSEPA